MNDVSGLGYERTVKAEECGLTTPKHGLGHLFELERTFSSYWWVGKLLTLSSRLSTDWMAYLAHRATVGICEVTRREPCAQYLTPANVTCDSRCRSYKCRHIGWSSHVVFQDEPATTVFFRQVV